MPLVKEQIGRITRQLRDVAGPSTLALLEQPTLEDLALNPDGSLWQKLTGQPWQEIGSMPEDQSYDFISSVASLRGLVINKDEPVIETILPLSEEYRFEGVIAPMVRRPCFCLRTRRDIQLSMEDYEEGKALTHSEDPLNEPRGIENFILEMKGKPHGEILREALRKRKNILVTGAPGSGKTKFADMLLSTIGKITPGDRVLVIEDTPELYCNVPNFVDLAATKRFTMLDCLRVCLRLRGSRVIVGEVRGAEAHSMLKLWNTGTPGGIATAHADGALEGLDRLESCVAEATDAAQQHLIAQAVNLVVFIQEEPRVPAGRKVRELIAVTGYNQQRRGYDFVKL
jgi:Flp pilus assembly CpaF family ATPase